MHRQHLEFSIQSQLLRRQDFDNLGYSVIQKLLQPIWFLMIYLVWFIYPCLIPRSNSILKGQEATDLNGTVFQAQMLKNMALLWSLNQLLNVPASERFWNVFAVPQAVHWHLVARS